MSGPEAISVVESIAQLAVYTIQLIASIVETCQKIKGKPERI